MPARRFTATSRGNEDVANAMPSALTTLSSSAATRNTLRMRYPTRSLFEITCPGGVRDLEHREDRAAIGTILELLREMPFGSRMYEAIRTT
jgi:hypothetical protein